MTEEKMREHLAGYCFLDSEVQAIYRSYWSLTIFDSLGYNTWNDQSTYSIKELSSFVKCCSSVCSPMHEVKFLARYLSKLSYVSKTADELKHKMSDAEVRLFFKCVSEHISVLREFLKVHCY